MGQYRGQPLGLAFDAEDNLLIADAYKGLLSVSPAGEISVLTDSYNGVPMEYVDDVDVDAEGKIYFSDASTKFGAQSNGGTYAASLLDTMEHGGHGRLMVYDPADQSTSMLMEGLNFSNGVAVAEDSSFVLVNETGSYRLHKYWLKGDRAGTSEVLIDNLPGFPDNIVRGRDGRFWVGLVSPRSQQLDDMSASPFLRKIVQRLPASVRPQAVPYSHVFAMDKDGAGDHLTTGPQRRTSHQYWCDGNRQLALYQQPSFRQSRSYQQRKRRNLMTLFIDRLEHTYFESFKEQEDAHFSPVMAARLLDP